MSRWGRILLGFLAVLSPLAAVWAPGPASATVPSSTNVGNTGLSTFGFADQPLAASSSGVAFLRSTPLGRSPAYEGLAATASTPTSLTSLSPADGLVGIQGTLAVVTDFNGNVEWENIDGTGGGSGPAIPAASGFSSTGGNQVSAAPGGWVTLGNDSAMPPAAHLIEVSTGGSATDLGGLPTSQFGYSFTAGPNGVAYQAFGSGSPSRWTFIPYATPHTPVPLNSSTSNDFCFSVLSSDAICVSNGSPSEVILVPLDGSAVSSVAPPSGTIGLAGTASDAAWINPDGSFSYEPWGGGQITTVSSGPGLPAINLVSDGTHFIFSGDANAATAGIASLTPPATSSTSLLAETTASTEANGVAVTAGQVVWTDNHADAIGTGSVWDRTLTNSGSSLTAGATASLITSNATGPSLPTTPALSASGRRVLYAAPPSNPGDHEELLLEDPGDTATTLGPSELPPRPSVSGSRVLWFNASTLKWELFNAVTGSESDLSASIPADASASLWGSYVAVEKSDGSVWRWDISSPTAPPVQVLGPAGTGVTCAPATPGSPFVSDSYVGWSETCFVNGPPESRSGYDNVTTSSSQDLSTIGQVLALSGSYVAVAQTQPSPQNPVAFSAIQLGTSPLIPVGTAAGQVSLDGSTVAWIDQSGDVQAIPLTHVPDPPRYLGNGQAPSSLTQPGTWSAEWDASAPLSSCNVWITHGSTLVDTVPCDPTVMPFGEAVASWSGVNSSSQPVSPGSYTWTLEAAGTDGPLAAPDGSALTLGGTIAVTEAVPAAPTSVIASAGVGSATVSWTPPATGPTPTSYLVSSSPPSTPVSSMSTSATVSGLKAGTSYTFTVKALDSGGPSVPSAPSNAVVPTSVAAQNSHTTTGTNPTASTSTTSPAGATTTISATGTGTGSVTVATYPSDPEAAFQAGATYFDVSVGPSSHLTSLSVSVCGLKPGVVVSWWNPELQGWLPVSDATPVNSAGCTIIIINAGTSPSTSQLYGTIFAVSPPLRGYSFVGADGGIFTFGGAPFFGSTGGVSLAKPIVGMALTPDGRGYWLVASDGGIFAFGDARFFGSMGGKALTKPIVGMAATPDGRGYWLVASDGGIFAFGDARFFGSTGGKALTKPIVGMAATPDGRGYWLVASDGGIFAFGDARFFGSTGGKALTKPIVGMAPTADGRGYWLVASDGGIFAFGDAHFVGSTGGIALTKPVVGMAATGDGRGYWLVASDGGIFAFGDARFLGSTGGIRLTKPIVGMVAG